jgi:hypothetical protein
MTDTVDFELNYGIPELGAEVKAALPTRVTTNFSVDEKKAWGVELYVAACCSAVPAWWFAAPSTVVHSPCGANV